MKRLMLLLALAIGLPLTLVSLKADTAGKINKLSAYGYQGKSAGVKMVVDVEVARYRGNEKYIPLFVWLGQNEPKTIHADRSSFILVDPDGKEHKLPEYNTVKNTYTPTRMSNDYSRLRMIPDYASSAFYYASQVIRAAFFPNPSHGRVMYDHVEIGNRTLMKALLYFPNPMGKAKGTYKLIYHDPKSDTKVVVPFQIPWI